MPERMRERKPCGACGTTFKTCPNFGAVSCLACASFFRRTVSFGIKFLCKENNNCPILPNVRIICRSCRYDNCIKAGMRRELVQSNRDGCPSDSVGRKQNMKSSQNDPKLPKYVAKAWMRGKQEVLRGFATTSVSRSSLTSSPASSICTSSDASCSSSSSSSPECSPSSSRSCSPAEKSEFSTMLNMSHDELLQFYVRHTEEAVEQDSSESVSWKSLSDHLAMKLCTMCPGSDLLTVADLQILYRHCQFVTHWLDVAWKRDESDLIGDQSAETILFRDFKLHLDATLALEMSRLRLDVVEYAALKSFCIWKLGILDSTLTLRVIAEEQYQGVVRALSKYYQNTKGMKPFEMATRLGDITLLMGPIFNAYQKASNMYEELNITSTVSSVSSVSSDTESQL